MDRLHGSSEPLVLAFAAQLASDCNFEGLQQVALERKDVLSKDILYRLLLTFWPTDESGTLPLATVLRNAEDSFSNISSLDGTLDISFLDKIPKRDSVQQMQLLPLPSLQEDNPTNPGDLIARFIVSWAHRLESLGCSLQPAAVLTEEFGGRNHDLQAWSRTYLYPVLRLHYDFYPEVSETIGVQELENIHGIRGVQALLQCAEQPSGKKHIARDLDEIVTPWVQGSQRTKRRRLSSTNVRTGFTTTSWQDVNDWLLKKSLDDFDLASEVLLGWRGPVADEKDENVEDTQETRARYAQTAFAVIYAQGHSLTERASISKNLLRSATGLLGLRPPDISIILPNIPSTTSPLKATPVDLLQNALLRPENVLTKVSESSANFLAGVLATTEILSLFKLSLTIPEVAKTCLFAPAEQQRQNLRKILQQIPRMTNADIDWQEIRQHILWLRSWQADTRSNTAHSSGSNNLSYLSYLDASQIDVEVLDSILASGQLVAAKSIYLERAESLLSMTTIEKRVIAAIFDAYDNASNGNLHRGGVKRAHELLRAFQPYFPDSESLKHIKYLIKATHSLSFYPLTLQHGVPFQPVNIRVHKDPLSLVGKVLEQDSKAYTKLDDLIEIGRNLVLADLPNGANDGAASEPTDLKIINAERKITYLAIISALTAHDFDTAYSYIITRLSNTSAQPTPSAFVDDMSWRAAYAAGKYRPATSPQSLHSRIASLSKRMDLLSQALTLAPNPENLSEILGTWRRCEEEMDGLKTQALDEERSFETKTAGTVPGGFDPEDRDLDAAETRQAMARRTLADSSASYEEEAPMGLFDVAKGAANALHRSAFPLSKASAGGFKVGIQNPRSSNRPPNRQRVPSQTSMNDGDRVRKRDMVSNMVTGGLRSGMGWVLGAQPVEKAEYDETERL